MLIFMNCAFNICWCSDKKWIIDHVSSLQYGWFLTPRRRQFEFLGGKTCAEYSGWSERVGIKINCWNLLVPILVLVVVYFFCVYFVEEFHLFSWRFHSAGITPIIRITPLPNHSYRLLAIRIRVTNEFVKKLFWCFNISRYFFILTTQVDITYRLLSLWFKLLIFKNFTISALELFIHLKQNDISDKIYSFRYQKRTTTTNIHHLLLQPFLHLHFRAVIPSFPPHAFHK